MAGRTGRRALPTAVKRARGERRSSRLNPREPRPTPGRPARTSFDLPLIAVEWERIAALAEELGVLTPADGPALELAARASAEIIEADRRIAKDGMFYRTKTESGSKMVRIHPAVAVRADAQRRLLAVLAHFGLTPSSRAKVQTAPTQELNELEKWELIRGGKA